MKSFKQQQKIYNKLLKLRTKQNEANYKVYKNVNEAKRKNILL